VRTSKDIIQDINQFEPRDENWLELDALLGELWRTGDQENFTVDLLKIFERFPEEDGGGVLWSIIHGVESFRSYERELIDSLNRQPSEMGLLMLRRIKNAGTKIIGGIEINKIVRDLLSNGKTSPTLRQELLKIGE
jgi:hypothetical protein